uniref:Uncharacterized protein n=1 Tax=Tanacetum cinerariifolium TaxID=118510 RepID=A0A699JPK6_TANCI|nr:hypothetical protein [Tanacetum cinerariifolium]
MEQERSKKQKVKDDKESEELKKCLEIIPDDGDDVTIDATHLSSKSPTIVDYKIYKEGMKNYFQIFRADDRFEKVKPVDNMDSFLLHNLKTMFEHHVKDNMFNDVKLQVDYECKMAFELLRLVKKQLKEGYRRIVRIKSLHEVTAIKVHVTTAKQNLVLLRVSQYTKSSRSKSTDNTKNDRILQITSSIQKKNKVKDHFRIVKSSLNKSNCVVNPSGNANVQHSKLNTNSELIGVKCNSSLFDARHELCFLEFISDMNASSKSKTVKKAKKKEEWKPTEKVFTKIRYH